jgi:carotenoid 1,2-hydratase
VFVGSVFSPWYFARRGAGARAEDHAAVNVILYRAGADRWAFTERPASALTRAADHVTIGPSSLSWSGDALTLRFEERVVPWRGRLRGTLTLRPELVDGTPLPLDPAGQHRWCPIAPRARVEVVLDEPALRFTGDGYLDANHGDGPLDEAFRRWWWARAVGADDAVLLYEAEARDGSSTRLARRYVGGAVEVIDAGALAALPTTGYRIPRQIRSDAGTRPALVRTFEDTPFYARSQVGLTVGGRPYDAVHEALDLDRFRAAWVRFLLPFRIRREAQRP